MKRTVSSLRIELAAVALCAAAAAAAVVQFRYDLRRERAEALRRLDVLAEQQSLLAGNWIENGLIDLRTCLALSRSGGEAMAAYRTVVKRADYVSIQHVDLSGRRVAGAFREAGPKSLPDARFRAAAMKSPEGIAVFGWDAEQSRPIVDLALPDIEGGELAGAVFLRMDPRVALFRALESAHGFSATADTLLVRRDGDDVVYLTDLRTHPGPPLRRPISEPRSLAAKALRGGAFDGSELDYDGRRVLADARRVRGTDWILIAKIEAAEISSPALRRAVMSGALVVGLILFGAAVFLRLYRRQEALRVEAEFESKREIIEKTRVVDAFFRHSPTPIVFLDRDFNYLRVNEAYAKACGKPAEDFPGRGHFELFPHAEREGIFRRVSRTKTPYRAAAEPFEFAGRDGTATTYWDWALVPLLDSAGEVDSLVFSMEDVTERVRARTALEFHAAELDDLYNKASCGHHSLDEDGTYLRVNDTELSWLGWRREELVGRRKFAELLTPASLKAFRDELPRLKERGWTKDLELELLRKDGSILPVLLSSTADKDESGRFVRCVSTIYDMTDRRRAEEARERLAAMIEGSDDAIIGAAFDGTITSWNGGARRLYGWTAEETLGERAAILIPPGVPDDSVEMFSKIRRGDRVETCEKNHRRKDGRVIRVSLAVSPVKEPSGAIVGASVVVRDVTSRWEAEGAIARFARALRTISLCNEAVIRAGTESELFENICRVIVQWGGHRLAWVGLRADDGARSVRPVAQAGFDEGYLAGLRATWADEERGRCPVGAAIRSGVADACRDVRTDPRMAPWREESLKRGYRSIAALPLVSEGGAFGALVIHSEEAGAFDDDELQVLKELAEDLAYGVSVLRARAARELAEESLGRSELRYRRLFESAKDGIMIVGAAAGEIRDANPALLNLVGYAKEECVGRRLWEFEPFRAAASAKPGLRELASRGDTRYDDLVLSAKDGRAIPVEFFASLYAVDGERLVQCGVRDVSERRRLQDQMRHAQKMESVGILAGGVAHDFNNLLMTILANCSFLLSSIAGNDPRRADVEEIKAAGERAAALTRQLLIFSRKQTVRPVVLDLNELIGNLQKMLRRVLGEDVKLETSLPPEPLPVRADPGQLEQALMNLAVNARDAMPRGGRLSLRASRGKPGEASHPDCAARGPDALYARLQVEDTGSGMTPEVREHLFEPFFTTKPAGKGTGLGLSTVYGIVRQSGGGIGVWSEPGRGTAFTIDLPLAEPAGRFPTASGGGAPSPYGSVAAPEARGRETILLVEDDEMLRRVDLRLLEERGYRVLPARDGEEALALLHDGGKDADLLLTDVVMPGIGGGELAREALKLKPGLKVLFVSGYAEHGTLEQLRETSFELLQKPVLPDVLARKVREALDSQKG